MTIRSPRRGRHRWVVSIGTGRSSRHAVLQDGRRAAAYEPGLIDTVRCRRFPLLLAVLEALRISSATTTEEGDHVDGGDNVLDAVYYLTTACSSLVLDIDVLLFFLYPLDILPSVVVNQQPAVTRISG